MTPAQLDQIEKDATALRKLACKVLDQVQQARSAAPAQIQKKQKSLDRQADIMIRVMTGRRKPIKS